jgi:hypothetical protein
VPGYELSSSGLWRSLFHHSLGMTVNDIARDLRKSLSLNKKGGGVSRRP